MTTIAVTGATGHLGRLTVEALLDRGVPAETIVAIVRNPAKAVDLDTRGVELRTADYGDRDALGDALAGIDRLLLVSSSAVGQRLAHHVNVITAAETAGVKLVAYTSVLNADRTTMQLAHEHQATEARLHESSVPFVLLRNGWYSENYSGPLASTLEQGALLGAAGDGRVDLAAREDFAEAAAAVLTTDGHEGRAYELTGDDKLTMAEVAAAISKATGREIPYRDLPLAEYEQILVGAGLPAPLATIIADSSAAIGRGELTSESRDLARLIDRPTTPFRATVEAAAAALGQ